MSWTLKSRFLIIGNNDGNKGKNSSKDLDREEKDKDRRGSCPREKSVRFYIDCFTFLMSYCLPLPPVNPDS